MPIKIDLMLMRQAVVNVRLPGEPERQGYLNRRTGEVVFVFDTEQDACWPSSKKPPSHYTRAEIEASADEWLRIPARLLIQTPDFSKLPDPQAEFQELADPSSVKAHLYGYDSLHVSWFTVNWNLAGLRLATGERHRVERIAASCCEGLSL